MKSSVALIILTLLVFSSFGLAMERHFEYEKAYENDKGIYIYFRIILLYSEMTLDKVIAEDNESIYYAGNVEAKLNTTRDEVEFYKSFGIESRVEDYLPSFLELGEGVKDIAIGQRLFLDNIEIVKEMRDYYAYVNASRGLEMMGEGISSAERALDVIDTFEFVDEDNSTLTLDTSSLRKKLEKIKRMYSGYERVLSTYKVLPAEEAPKNDTNVIIIPTPLSLYASNLNPFIYENVTFYGYASGFDTVYLHIENQTIVLGVKNNRFSYVYSFDTVGKYEVFATGVKNGSVENSNVLIVNVVKIPTKIILSSKGSKYINESIRVSGVLLDYYGRPLKGEEVFGEFDGERFALVTSHDGSFSFNVTSDESGRKIANVTYPGSEIYAGSSASLGLVFLRYPVKITIKTEKDKFKIGEEVEIIGTVSGVKREIPVIIYVDDEPYTEIHAIRDFKVKVTFNETGEHRIYARFPGNDYYEATKSNMITLKIVEFSLFEILITILIFGLLFGIGFLGYKIYRRGRKGVTDEEFVALIKALEEAEKMKEPEGERKLKSLRQMYREIYQKLLKQYNLKPSITPRELIRRLRGENFSYHLEKITHLHERHVYGKKPLKRQGVLEFLRNVAGFIVSFIVREEL
ncbi:MAG TPA: Ig-like domain repeat protein [Thermococcaceae archaeon]|nr:Ig-like domain repeat protein [Thermococcaceae archaeon]